MEGQRKVSPRIPLQNLHEYGLLYKVGNSEGRVVSQCTLTYQEMEPISLKYKVFFLMPDDQSSQFTCFFSM